MADQPATLDTLDEHLTREMGRRLAAGERFIRIGDLIRLIQRYGQGNEQAEVTT